MWGYTSWYFGLPFLKHLAILTAFHGTCLECCDWNLHVEIGFLKVCPSWPSFLLACPRTLWEGRCFLLAAPQAWWMWSARPHTFARGFMAENQKATTCLQASCWFFFFLAVVSLLLCIGIELICVVVFVSCVQELDSVPLRCSSVLFWVLFSYEVITMFSSLSCGI